MAIRKFKPTTPGQRNKAISAFDEITTNKPQKSLLAPLKRTGGRNNTGQMTMRYIGGGHKKMYRIIDFLRNKDNVPAEVLTIEYDPNRSARIALVQYEDGEKRYILAPAGLKVGQKVESGSGVAPEVGNTLPLSEIPVGTMIHAIELRPGQGAAMARSAGAFAQLAAREGNHAVLRLPSGETRMVLVSCRATVGVVSNGECADPDECKRIADLGVDMLAAGIGNIHGKYPENWAGLSFDTLAAIQEKTGDMPLVLHGGTGIPADQIKKAINLGVSKINVNTECQLAFAEATRKYIEEGKDLQGKGYDPRKLLKPGAEAIVACVKEKMELFGSVGKA